MAADAAVIPTWAFTHLNKRQPPPAEDLGEGERRAGPALRLAQKIIVGTFMEYYWNIE